VQSFADRAVEGDEMRAALKTSVSLVTRTDHDEFCPTTIPSQDTTKKAGLKFRPAPKSSTRDSRIQH
jgi:hypothetical protein